MQEQNQRDGSCGLLILSTLISSQKGRSPLSTYLPSWDGIRQLISTYTKKQDTLRT